MAKYAISLEGVAALNNLTNVLKQSINNISSANNTLQNSITGIMDRLGIYGIDIWNISLNVKQYSEDASKSIEALAQLLNNKANEIEEMARATIGGFKSSQSNNLSGNSSNKVYSIEEIAEQIRTINPHYRDLNVCPWKKSPYRTNCGSCAFIVEKFFLEGTIEKAGCTNIGTDEKMEEATGKKCVYMEQKNIANKLKEQGPGAHMIVGITRKKTPFGKDQAGHWFNAYYDGQNIYTIDGQSGKILDWPHNYGNMDEWCAMV